MNATDANAAELTAYGVREIVSVDGRLVGEYLLHEPRPSPFHADLQIYTHLWGVYPTQEQAEQELALAHYFKNLERNRMRDFANAYSGL